MNGLLVGRFQPFHNGHLELLLHIRQTFRPTELFVGVGSALASHTERDPFTAGERITMIVRTLTAERQEHVWPLPIPDLDRHAVWVRHVESLVPEFQQVYTNDPLTRLLFEEAGYQVPKLPFFNRGVYEGSEIRRRMVAGEPWADRVPVSVHTYLQEIKGEERVRLLARRPAEATAPPGEGRSGQGVARTSLR